MSCARRASASSHGARGKRWGTDRTWLVGAGWGTDKLPMVLQSTIRPIVTRLFLIDAYFQTLCPFPRSRRMKDAVNPARAGRAPKRRWLAWMGTALCLGVAGAHPSTGESPLHGGTYLEWA